MTIKFGVIGTNWITESFIKAAGEIEDFQLNAVYSRTADKAKAFADKFNVEHTFTNLEEMAKSDKSMLYILQALMLIMRNRQSYF